MIYIIMRKSSISDQYFVEKVFSTEEKADDYIKEKSHENQNWPYIHRYVIDKEIE